MTVNDKTNVYIKKQCACWEPLYPQDSNSYASFLTYMLIRVLSASAICNCRRCNGQTCNHHSRQSYRCWQLTLQSDYNLMLTVAKSYTSFWLIPRKNEKQKIRQKREKKNDRRKEMKEEHNKEQRERERERERERRERERVQWLYFLNIFCDENSKHVCERIIMCFIHLTSFEVLAKLFAKYLNSSFELICLSELCHKPLTTTSVINWLFHSRVEFAFFVLVVIVYPSSTESIIKTTV